MKRNIVLVFVLVLVLVRIMVVLALILVLVLVPRCLTGFRKLYLLFLYKLGSQQKATTHLKNLKIAALRIEPALF